MTAYTNPTNDSFRAFRECVASGQIQMLNLVELRTTAAYLECAKHRTAGVENSRLIRMSPLESGAGFGK